MTGTIIGILVAIILGVPAILLTIKSIRRIYIAYVQFDLVSLIRTLVKEIKDIQITHKGELVDPGIYLLRSALFNLGNNDIDKSIVHEPLEITFPKGYEILELSVGETPTCPKCQVINGNTIRFEWEVFKRKEYIPFKVLLRISSEISPAAKNLFDDLFKQVAFKERISNLDRIKKVRANEFNILTSKAERITFSFVVSMFIAIIVFAMFMNYITPPRKIAYRYEDLDKIERVVQITAHRNDAIKIKEINGSFRKVIPIKDFDPTSLKGLEAVPDVVRGWPLALLIPFVLLPAFLIMGMVVPKLIMKKRYGKLISAFTK